MYTCFFSLSSKQVVLVRQLVSQSGQLSRLIFQQCIGARFNRRERLDSAWSAELNFDEKYIVGFKINMAMNAAKYMPVFVLFLITTLLMTSASARGMNDSIPTGWRAGSKTGPDFIMGIDLLVKRSGKVSGYIRREPAPDNESGALMQSIAADPYRNKRVRFSVYLKTSEVQSAYIFFAVHSPDSAIAYANNNPQALHESTDWTLCQLTLDIAENSRNLDFGVILSGQGRIWIDDGTLEIVNASIASNDLIATGQLRKQKLPPRKYPVNPIALNLDFEDQP